MHESEIFAVALARRPGSDRDAYLANACGGDSQLRERIEKLLAAHENPNSYLSYPLQIDVTDPALVTTMIQEELDSAGKRIGPYKLLQQIGEGGMGIVFMAEQTEPVHRRVALKVIKPGMDSRAVIARFEAERQALAMMDHPNIARVLDAGATEQGRPYFVMELVNGAPITQYCDEHQLSTHDRLNLFAEVCRGVQHAHHKGVIHRDLKPSNILVAQYDHQPVPKVIDFGVAKATNQQLTNKTLFTEFGQVIGTLNYMSPEQAKRNQLDVDTRSDVYSLGAVLYELLTGDTPVDLRQLREAGFDEMLRMIREQDTPRPSDRLSTSSTLPQIATCRRAQPKQLTSLVRGDLDWIVLKALHKNRVQRYGSAQDLADDVMRHLNQRPITAGPPRVWTRIGKFAARNRSRLQIAALAVACLLVVIATAVWTNWQQSQREHAAREAARRRGFAVIAAIEDAAAALGEARRSPLESGAAWRAAQVSRRRIEDLLADGPVTDEANARAESFLARYDDARDQREIADRLEESLITGASHPDLESWQQMEVELRQLFLDHGFDLDQEPPAEIAKRIGRHPHADRFSDALEMWMGTIGHMGGLGGPKLTREEMLPWIEALYTADRDPLRRRIRQIVYGGQRPDRREVEALADDLDYGKVTPRTLSWLAMTLAMAGATERSDQVYRESLLHHSSDLMLNFDYGFTLASQQRWQEAIRMYTRCLAIRSNLAGIWQNMGLAMKEVGELNNAREALRRSTELEQDYGPTWVNLGNVLLQLEDSEEALDTGMRAVELMPERPDGHGVVGRALMQLKRFGEALHHLEVCHRVGQGDRRWRQPSQQWLEQCRQALAGSDTNQVESSPVETAGE